MWAVALFFLLISFLDVGPVHKLFYFLFSFVCLEVYTVYLRRKRDDVLATLSCVEDETSFRASVAKESVFGSQRPFLAAICVFGIFSSTAAVLDEYGQCFWNWECWTDLDCQIRILIPAVMDCVFEIGFPAAIFVYFLISVVIASIWCCTRPIPAALFASSALVGAAALVSSNGGVLFLCFLASVAVIYTYFKIIPNQQAGPPSWYQDLGSLAACSDPTTGMLRDGISAIVASAPQTSGRPTPSGSELSCLPFSERLRWRAGVLAAGGCCGGCCCCSRSVVIVLRAIWNSWILRPLICGCFRRRVHVHGAQHVAHIASHDSVLLVGKHTSHTTFLVAAAAGLAPVSGATLALLRHPRRAGAGGWTSLLAGALSAGALSPPVHEGCGGDGETGDGGETEDGKGGGGYCGGAAAGDMPRWCECAWNGFVLRRLAHDLSGGGAVVGLSLAPQNAPPSPPAQSAYHPVDPADHLHDAAAAAAAAAAGRLALESPQAHVIPMLVEGLGGGFWCEVARGFTFGAWDKHPIHVVFGPHVDLSHLRPPPPPDNPTAQPAEASPDAVRRAAWAAGGEMIAAAVETLSDALAGAGE